MKKIILAISIILISMSLQAQMKLDTKNENIEVSKIYLGILNTSAFSLDSLNVGSTSTFRVGAEVKYHMGKFHLESFILNEISKGKNISIGSFGLKYDLSKKSYLKIGQIATPITLFRPHPVSQDAQFESWTTSQLPIAGLGVMYHLNDTNLGIYSRAGNSEFHISQEFKYLKFGGWYSENQHGLVLKYKKNKITTHFFYKNDREETVGNLFVYKLNKKGDLNFYNDFGYSLTSNEIVRFQPGILKDINIKFIKGYLGVAFDVKTNEFKGNLQINL